ncbi:HEAT domain containing protein [Rubidibacter lacunae KORDI 51-2]|uniref:HEAT domain containing protein n=1 Tax=Rubidibacter lacunae KORDI 51-2 TaxID=582515 RepID=U5DPJ5_9CHRO|nr:HEAT repeat domain-containing protein [Rubidibacter lacunae]ERN42787.1 HEAT domain containing protein [Rubidibacter lacunae KORDI 51-2]
MSTTDLKQVARDLESPNLRDRLLALVSLREVDSEAAVPLIEKVLGDESLQVRSMAIFALGVKPTDRNFGLLIELLEDPDYGIRADAAGALGYLGDERALTPLIRLFYEDTDWLVRFSAAVSIGNLRDCDPRAEAVLRDALNSEEVVIQHAAIAALGEIGAVEAVEDILRFARSDDWLVRQRLTEALGNLPTEKTVSALKFLAKDEHPQVAQSAAISLRRLEGQLLD